jgi:hypothetical protein
MTNVAPAPRLLAQLRQAIRLHHYSPRTEEASAGWVRGLVRLPVVLAREEARAALDALGGVPGWWRCLCTGVGGRLRYPNSAGIAEAPGRGNHDGLHPRAEPGWFRRAERGGPALACF